MNITIIDWDEIEYLVAYKTRALGRTDGYKKLPVPKIISQADVRRMSDALAYLMMGGEVPKPKQPLR